MKKILFVLMLTSIGGYAQTSEELSILDGRHWGVVLFHPEMAKVTVKPNVTFLSDPKGTLKMDVYLPPGISSNEQRPAVVFLNAIGDQAVGLKVKNWGIYNSWPRLMAANGYIGISMECDGSRVQESLDGLFKYIDEQGSTININRDKLGVYAASANVNEATTYLMKNEAYKGIKAAVLYYGGVATGPYRKDLPVLFTIAEGDVARNGYGNLWQEVLKNNAPWTIQMGSGLIHAFDAFNDNDDARKVIKQTISFWKNNLDPIPEHKWENSIGREILAAEYGHDDQKALALLKTYIEQHPEDPDGRFQYGDFLKNQRQYAEAESVFRKLLTMKSDHLFAQADLVVVLYAQGKDAEGSALAAKLEKVPGVNHDVYVTMAYALFGMGKHKEGIPFFEKAIAFGANRYDYYNLACGYARLNNVDKAVAALKKSIELGAGTKEQIERDEDFNSIRSDKKFQDVVAALK